MSKPIDLTESQPLDAMFSRIERLADEMGADAGEFLWPEDHSANATRASVCWKFARQAEEEEARCRSEIR